MKRMFPWTLAIVSIAFLLASGIDDHDLAAQGQGPTRYFPETGHTIRNRFLAYWTAHGGLAQQGYPISEELQEQSLVDGQVYTVQYFERAVFEYHPDYAGTPSEVLLQLLGTTAYQQRYGPKGAAPQQPSTDNPRFFPETRHSLGGRFRTYWEQHGGLAQYGYPLSEEFPEQSTLDGKFYTVQYFQRAVFEYHPEYAGTAYDVLLSQLGTYRYQSNYDSASAPAPTRPPPAPESPMLASIDMTSPAEGWAVGWKPIQRALLPHYDPIKGWTVSVGPIWHPLLLHYDGRQWTEIPNGIPNSRGLLSVDMVSADEGWAVGFDLIVHYHGGHWTEQAPPPTPYSYPIWGELRHVQMVSASEGWAVGGSGAGKVDFPIILHYTEGQWDTIGLATSDYYLEGLSLLPSGEGWAVGSRGTILHLVQGLWSKVASPVHITLNDVSAISADAAWAVGEDGTILHYSAGQWQVVPGPAGMAVYGLKMVSDSEGWALANDDQRNRSAILHYSNGGWSVFRMPPDTGLIDLSLISAREWWALGTGVIIHYDNGVWNLYNQ